MRNEERQEEKERMQMEMRLMSRSGEQLLRVRDLTDSYSAYPD
jgi:hypothetical protein